MANEAVILELSGQNPIPFTCAAGTSISKGTLLKLSGDHTVVASDGDNVYAGVAAADKDGADASTRISVYAPGQDNTFDMLSASTGTIGAGVLVSLSGANIIKAAAAADVEDGKVIGKTEEAAGTSEVIRVRS